MKKRSAAAFITAAAAVTIFQMAPASAAAAPSDSAPSAPQVEDGTVEPFAEGNNGCAHISLSGYPAYWHATGSRGCPLGFYGHFQITGPGVNKSDGDRGIYSGEYIEAGGVGAGQVCVTAWRKDPGTWTNIGRACHRVY